MKASSKRDTKGHNMSDKQKLISDEPDEAVESESPTDIAKKELNAKLPWHYATGFLIFWVLLFIAIVVPLFYRLPAALTVEDANKDVFIAERAQKILYDFNNIGPKVVGSSVNENITAEFLINELQKIEQDLNTELFDLYIDLQQVSGAYILSTMINMYQGVQNVVAQLSPKNPNSKEYLLINSHFDSKPRSPGAGDAGHMVVTMLEVLRVLATSAKTFEHPVVFLFNGAEENPLQASHGFITQHDWAQYCTVFINLDAAGSGGREFLFQTGPNHAWLADYYSKLVKHPLATSMAEEIFASGIIPSDTDFRIFRDFGQIPGLDMAQAINGYVYHTKYDHYDQIPRASLQNTGDNLLSLVRGLSNASEMYDTEAHAEGHAVFFDFLGLFVVCYSEQNGQILNYSVALLIIVFIIISLWRMSAVSDISFFHVLRLFTLVQILQIIGFVFGLALPLVVAYGMDSFGLSLTYFTSSWLIFGLYVTPSLLGLTLPFTVYNNLCSNQKISSAYRIQLALHGHSVILGILDIALTLYGLRSAYILTIALIFYLVSLALNLLTTLHDRGYAWTGLLKTSQVIPFLYLSYLFYTFLVVLIPMMGRFGTTTNPDLIISVLSALGTVLALGFLIPLINMFRRPSLVLITLLFVTGLSIYAATTNLGFPYRPKTNVERVNMLHVQRIFYEYDGNISKDESGYYFDVSDRRGVQPFQNTVNLTGLLATTSDCEKYMMCGIPLYDRRWTKSRLQGKWLPTDDTVEFPYLPQLELLNKTITGTTARLFYKLKGPDHMSIFLQPNEDVVVSNWSFLSSYLEQSSVYPPPYHIYFAYGNDNSPLIFWFDITKPNGDFEVPLGQMGISGHYINYDGDKNGAQFASEFPPYTVAVVWPASYQRYIF